MVTNSLRVGFSYESLVTWLTDDAIYSTIHTTAPFLNKLYCGQAKYDYLCSWSDEWMKIECKNVPHMREQYFRVCKIIRDERTSKARVKYVSFILNKVSFVELSSSSSPVMNWWQDARKQNEKAISKYIFVYGSYIQIRARHSFRMHFIFVFLPHTVHFPERRLNKINVSCCGK